MSTVYLAMSAPFILWAVGLATLARWRYGLHLRGLIPPTSALLVATAVFDNLIIWSGLVAYDESKILGWRIGMAPIEDFLYTIVAVVVVASLWRIFAGRESR